MKRTKLMNFTKPNDLGLSGWFFVVMLHKARGCAADYYGFYKADKPLYQRVEMPTEKWNVETLALAKAAGVKLPNQNDFYEEVKLVGERFAEATSDYGFFASEKIEIGGETERAFPYAPLPR